jgi:hypothetical protein
MVPAETMRPQSTSIARRHRHLGTAWVIAALLLLATGLPTATTPDSEVRVDRQVLAGGGTVPAQSATLRLSGTLGQVAAGRAQSDAVEFGAGFWSAASAPCDCRYHGDIDANGVVTLTDVVRLIDVAFRSGADLPKDHFCPHVNRGDYNCDGVINLADVVRAVNTAFRDNDMRCDPCSQR